MERRGAPLSLGGDAVQPPSVDQQALTTTIGDLLTMPTSRTPARLAALGVAFVFAPGPVDPEVAAALDAVPALSQASADDPDARAWRLDQPTRLPTVDAGARSWLRPFLLVAQGLALVTVVVLAAPTRRRQP